MRRAGSPGWRHVRRLYRTGEFDVHHLSLGVALNFRKKFELSSHQISQLGSCGVPGSLRKNSTLSSHQVAMPSGGHLWSHSEHEEI